jgi:hypothetical protein
MAEPKISDTSTLGVHEAKQKGALGKTSRKNDIVVSRPFMEILIGGPYAFDGEDHTYGHVALRVFMKNEREFVYDFGRYGLKWNLGSEGEGILRVWTSFQQYITSENFLGRTTDGFLYHLDEKEAEAIISYFEYKVNGIKIRKQRKDNPNDPNGKVIMKEYRLSENYHAVNSSS